MRRGAVLVAFLALGGCDGVFKLSHLPEVGEDAGVDSAAAAPDAAMACFEELFDPPTVNLTRWTTYTQQNTQVSADGALAITLDSTTGNAYAGVREVATRDASGIVAEVELVAPSPEMTPGAHAYLRWYVNANNYYDLELDGNDLRFVQRRAGVDNVVGVGTYDRSDPPRFWRISHSVANNMLTFWTRTMTGAWREHASTAAGVPVTAIVLDVGAGTTVDFNAPGQARFDNVRVYCK